MSREAYRVLGLEPGASANEIKAAYRKQAAACHPDRNPDDPAAADRFRRVREAYRALIDAPTPDYTKPSITATPAEDTSWRTQLRSFVDNFKREAGPRPKRGNDVAYRLQLSFTDAIGGGTYLIAEHLQVTIPAGAEDGDVLRITGEGDDGRHGGTPGDFLVEIEVAPHPLFVRDGRDVAFDLPVPFPVAVLGGEVTVPTPGGRGTLTVPAGCRDGQVLRLGGQGVAGGDLLITVHPEMPVGLTAEMKATLERFAGSTGEAQYPRTKLFRKNYLS